MFNYSKIAEACVKCGKCIPVCTIHQNSSDEVTSPRGFIELLREYEKGNLELDKNAKDIFESCFLCTNCVSVCPNSLPTDLIIEEVRSDIAKKYGIAFYKKAFFYLLRNRLVMDLLSKVGYVFRNCAFSDMKEKSSIKPKFDLPMIKKDRLLPSLSSVSFLNKYPKELKNGGVKRVAIFIGCLANYNYLNIGDSLVAILKELKIDIFFAKEQLCCGAPAYFTGDFDTVRYLATKNITYFESFIDSVDAIIIPEATCSAMIKHDYEVFFRDDLQMLERVKKLNQKIFLATEYLSKHTDLKELLKSKNRVLNDVITYHDPCHARKVQGVYKEPRELISQNYKLIEMSDPNICCGFGGVTIQSEKFNLAQSAGVTKANMIKATNANIVSAECSACRVQLTNALYQNGVEVNFKNPIELIAESLKD